jgi:hypothetical protein
MNSTRPRPPEFPNRRKKTAEDPAHSKPFPLKHNRFAVSLAGASG